MTTGLTQRQLSRPERACWPIKMWPPTDCELWLASLQPGDLLDGEGSRANHREISNRKVEKGYGRWLNHLNCRGHLSNNAPAERITREAVDDYVRELRALGNSTQTVQDRLQELHDAATVMDPGRDWHWLREVEGRIRRIHQPVRDKQQTLVGANDLIDVGRELMAEARRTGSIVKAAKLFRDGLLLAFAAYRPLRRKNLANFEIGQHLIETADCWFVRIEGNEVKNKVTLTFYWPDALVAGLNEYLLTWRPILCQRRGRRYRPAGSALWVSSHGSAMTQQAIYDRIVKVTKAAFGHAVCPHRIRDVAATTQAVVDPANTGRASSILGHRQARATEKYYIHARSLDASARYQEEIEALRQQSKPRGGPPSQPQEPSK